MANAWKSTSQCFGCAHFKQYHPLWFKTPGECGWEPGHVPGWLQDFLDSTDSYHGPKRGVESEGYFTVTDCPVFKQKED